MAEGTAKEGAMSMATPQGELPAAVVKQIADRVYELWRKELRTGFERAGLAGRRSTDS